MTPSNTPQPHLGSIEFDATPDAAAAFSEQATVVINTVAKDCGVHLRDMAFGLDELKTMMDQTAPIIPPDGPSIVVTEASKTGEFSKLEPTLA